MNFSTYMSVRGVTGADYLAGFSATPIALRALASSISALVLLFLFGVAVSTGCLVAADLVLLTMTLSDSASESEVLDDENILLGWKFIGAA